jgi:hypothetical protein
MSLSAPTRTLFFSNPRLEGASTPFFSHDYLVQFVHESSSSGTANVYLYDSSGQLGHEVRLWPEGATHLFLSAVDVGAGKQMTFAGQVKMQNGKECNFIGVSDLDGKKPGYFDTGSYLATQLTQTDDGSIWTVGAERYERLNDSTIRSTNYDMVRHYAPNGSLIDHFLPRFDQNVTAVVTSTKTDEIDGGNGSTNTAYNLQGEVTPTTKTAATWGYRDAWKNSRQAYLRSSGEQVALLDGLHGRICTYVVAAKTFPCTPVVSAALSFNQITGFALSDSGDVLASMKREAYGSDPLYGLFLLVRRSDGSGYQWKSVPDTMESESGIGAFRSLLGSTGDVVVYRREQQTDEKATAVYESRWH